MEDKNEKIAQLKHENLKLHDELNHLKELFRSIEENFSSSLTQQANYIKSLQQQVNGLNQTLRERDETIDIIEHANGQLSHKNEQIISELNSLKEKYLEEKLLNKEIKDENEEIKNENLRLTSKLEEKTKEYSSCVSNVENLVLRVKELEDESEELKSVRDMLLMREKKEKKASSNSESLTSNSTEWSSTKSQSTRNGEPNFVSNDNSKNLHTEILEVEVQEKQSIIDRLESLLRKKEEEEEELNKLRKRLKEKLDDAGLLTIDSSINFKVDSSFFYDVYHQLVDLLLWPEGQSGECKPLTDVASLSVVVKDGIQTTQPGSIRIVETISIASQTDPIKNLSPVLQFKSLEKFDTTNCHSPADSDDEGQPLSVFEGNDLRKNFQLFSVHKNCDLDMDMYRMSSDSAVSDVVKKGEDSNLTKEEEEAAEDPNNSRDVNLNSKNFADCNLIKTTRENGEIKKDVVTFVNSLSKESDSECSQSKKTFVLNKMEESDLNQSEDSNKVDSSGTSNELVVRNTSTPKPDLNGPQLSIPISESIDPVFSSSKNILSQSNSLSVEEIRKKFQDLSFAFKTDSTTIQKRLSILERKRNQAETNIESEVNSIKAKLKTLQYSSLNSVNLVSDIKKQLDFVLNAATQLSSSAENYGYVQHEEKVLDFVNVMVDHVENTESTKNEVMKVIDKLKGDVKRPQSTISLDDEDEDKILRRRSVAGNDGSCRRRASIATLPRIGSVALESNNGKGSPWLPSGRLYGRKLSFSQAALPRTHNNNLPSVDNSRRDSSGSRHRTESRTSESSMKNIEENPEQKSSPVSVQETTEIMDAECNTDENDSSLHLRNLYDSIDEIRRNSISQDTVNLIYCLRKIIHWNKLLISATRFRWPDSSLHYLPFYVTWYVVFLLTLVFVSGWFSGMSGCYTLLCWQYTPHWFAAINFFICARRFYRFLLLLFFIFFFAFILLLFWLTQVVHSDLTGEEVDELFRTFGLILEVKYPDGPPPV